MAFEKYKPWGLFSEFYGIRFDVFSNLYWIRIKRF